MISIIGPRNKPIIPINLKPVYIDIKVKIGCMPILLLMSFGSNTCLTIIVITYKPINTNANEILPSATKKTAQGIITVPEPKYWQGINKSN